MAYSVCNAPLKFISEMLPESHTMVKFDFLIPVIHSQIV